VSEPKQVIVMRKDLNMRKGKMVAQGAHASMAAILAIGQYIPATQSHTSEARFEIPLTDEGVRRWLVGGADVPPTGFKKICVGVDSEQELLDVWKAAQPMLLSGRLPGALIKDNGLTEFNGVPTYTCLALGPSEKLDLFDLLTGHLKLL